MSIFINIERLSWKVLCFKEEDAAKGRLVEGGIENSHSGSHTPPEGSSTAIHCMRRLAPGLRIALDGLECAAHDAAD